MFTFFLAVAISMAPPEPIAADIAWVAEGEFCEPETVLPLPDNTLLVSNVCDFRTQGNGFLSLLDKSGKILDWRVVEGLDAPLGMAMYQDRLHVIDNNQIKIFSWPDYEVLEVIKLDTVVANDLAISSEGIIYVSDTAGHQVVRVSTDREQSTFTSTVTFKSANGMAIDKGWLYVGGERLWRVNLQTGESETIGPPWIADIDGIELEHNGTIQVTPVGGALIRYMDEDNIEVVAGPGISSANHGFAQNINLVLIPTGFDNTVIAIRLPEGSERQ